MTDSFESRVKAIFQRALEVDAVSRAGFLERACDGDTEVRRRVEALLLAYEDAGAFLSEADEPNAPSADEEEGVGTVIDRYKLLQCIGEGGFGTVFMAEQSEPVKRLVALKVIKRGMDTKEVIARFEAERQALAMMDHPNIAKVLDAGATPRGRPYFVMELVRGVSIIDYCNEAQTDTARRLDLFRMVCDAIQHAHQKGVIHRDIKPSNVLVRVHDGRPVPKVIDFGIAKATDQRLTERTLFTETHQFVGTPEYMAPEQAELSGLDIDTRADVYSLGVLLYELLTGTKPFDIQVLLKQGFGAVLRQIREVDPPKPSSRVSTMGDERLVTVARQRSATPANFGRIIRGDLDWIVMKALEKDRTRRYETAHALALDIERYQRDEPVLARSPSAAYRLGKYLRRHRMGVGAAASVLVALVIGAVLALRGYLEADEQLGRALRAEASAREEAGHAVLAQGRADAEALQAKQERAKAIGAQQRADREASEAKRLGAQAVEERKRADREAAEAKRQRAEADRRFAIISRLMASYHKDLRDKPHARWSGPFLAGMQAALEEGDVGDIFFFLERARVDPLLDLLASRDQLSEVSLPKALRKVEQDARAEALVARRRYQELRSMGGSLRDMRAAGVALSAANDRLAMAILQIQRLVAAVAEATPALPVGLEELKQRLGPDQSYVAFAVLPERVFAFVAIAGGARVVDLGPVAPIQEAAEALKIADVRLAPALPLERLRALLIEPLELPARVRRVYFSPEAVLLTVPFGLLLDDREVAFTPSASTYVALLDRSGPVGVGVLAVADPDYRLMGKLFGPLPGARAEAASIGSTVLIGSHATEGRFKAALPKTGRLRGVHLACHGVLDNERPLLSALVLGADGTEDGYLTALEIAQLRIEADLVSLSSCDTARGEILQGGGIGSLTRAFLYAGAARLLVSQGKVDDQATAALMTRFYELWNPKDEGKRIGAVAALKAAQTYVRSHEKWEHPAFWAQWTIWGLAE